MMKNFKIILVLFVSLIQVGCVNSSAVSQPAEIEHVVLQLRWDHQFQFGGYYAADWQGFYEEAGLQTFNLFQANAVKNLIRYPLVELGHTNRYRWDKTHQFLHKIGLVKQDFDLERTQAESEQHPRNFLTWALVLTIITLIVSFGWVYVLGKVVRQRTGDLRQALMIKERAKAALQESEEKYRLLFENAGTGISYYTPQGKIVAFNKIAAQRMAGKPEDFVGQTVAGLFEGEVATFFQKRLEAIANSEASLHVYEDFVPVPTGNKWFRSIHTKIMDADGSVVGVQIISNDITDQKRVQGIQDARVRLVEFSVSHSILELLQAALDEAEALTGSSIGFYHFLGADQKTLSLQAWSTNTRETMCTTKGEKLHYNVDEAGVWVDCVHQRRPVIHNDYPSLPHRKGLPEGHAPVIRELAVPVFRDNQIVAILGVGNKAHNYTEDDVKVVSLLADLVWDIVERVRVQEALWQANQFSESLIASMKDGFSVVNSQGVHIIVNPALCQMTGFSEEELVGVGLPHPYWPPEHIGEIEKAFAATHRGEFDDFELTFMRKNGERFPVIVSPSLTVDEQGNVINYHATVKDITERKQAEDALRKSETQLSAIFNNSSDRQALLKVETDGSFRVIAVNQSYLEAVWYFIPSASRQTLVGKTLVEGFNVLGLDKDVLDYTLEFYRQAVETGAPVYYDENFDFEVGPYFSEVVIVPIFDSTETCRYLLWTSHNVTEHKQMEEQLKTSLKEKEVLLQELYHRTKNNMQVIHSMLGLQSAYIQDEQALTVFVEMQNRIQSMAMVHQKLIQSKNLTHIDLKEYINDLADYLTRSYNISSDRITLVKDVESLTVLVDIAVPCGLILTELISNVFKHAFPQNRTGEIKISLQKTSDGEITLQVADNGAGVPEGFNFRQTNSLGFRIIVAIAEHQLQGTVDLKTDCGVLCRIKFTDALYDPRV